MSSPVADDDAVRAFRGLLHVAQQLRYLFDRRLAEDGLTTAQATLLTFINRHEEPLSYTELAGLMASSHQNVAQIVRALEQRGFVEVRPDPEDGRVRRVHATEESRRYWKARDEDDVQYLRSLFAGLSEGDLRRLNGLLDDLRGDVQVRYDQARHPGS